jgi:hypothetical protein
MTRAVSSCARAFAGVVGRLEAEGRAQVSVDREASPRALSRGGDMLKLGQVSLSKGACEHTQWV